jgi:hypothetical protein
VRVLQSPVIWRIASWCRCKTNTIPILMHQMRISTNQVSSVVLRPKTLEIRKKSENCKRAKNQILCHEIEPNPSKDRAMHDKGHKHFQPKGFITFCIHHLFPVKIYSVCYRIIPLFCINVIKWLGKLCYIML